MSSTAVFTELIGKSIVIRKPMTAITVRVTTADPQPKDRATNG